MENSPSYAVILAGGRGERFWPLSTSRQPKQLLSLTGESTLLAQAVERLDGLIPPERIYVITQQDLVEASQRAAPSLPPENIIGEPIGRDTAAAAALGAALVKARDPMAAFCILTADHIIGTLPRYRQTLSESLQLARAQEVLITIGIEPKEPSTGYGYIEAAESYPGGKEIEFLRARRFVEKPDLETATHYLETERYFWNSGMFIWSVRALQNALHTFRPPLAQLIDSLAAAVHRPDFATTLAAAYDTLEKISIDYALMEKADNIVMARGTFAWDDVGAWPALENHFPSDADDNVLIGRGVTLDAARNIVYSKKRLTALIGVDDLVVVQADDVTLVCPRARAQDIKKLVERMKQHPEFSTLL